MEQPKLTPEEEKKLMEAQAKSSNAK